MYTKSIAVSERVSDRLTEVTDAQNHLGSAAPFQLLDQMFGERFSADLEQQLGYTFGARSHSRCQSPGEHNSLPASLICGA